MARTATAPLKLRGGHRSWLTGVLIDRHRADGNTSFDQPAEHREQAATVTRCARCTEWRHVGTFAEGREAFAAHRAGAHRARQLASGLRLTKAQQIRATC